MKQLDPKVLAAIQDAVDQGIGFLKHMVHDDKRGGFFISDADFARVVNGVGVDRDMINKLFKGGS